jgi:SAM-dependent methyltransferase
MLGLGHEFAYDECADCGTVQIRDVPPALASYYPEAYYSFAAPRARAALPPAAFLREQRDRAALTGAGGLGGWLARRRPSPELAQLRALGVRPGMRILDIGSGGGNLLLGLRAAGMAALDGIDPFLPADRDLGRGVRLRRRAIEDWDGGPYDLVMFHHSLEHVADPGAALDHARRLVHAGGRCLVRIPTTSSAAWRTYRTEWVQLDAPRHLVLFSRPGIRTLAAARGWAVRGIHDDSTAFQFWASEQYRRDIALLDPRSFARDPARLDPGLLAEYERRAAELNGSGDGDQVAVVLEPGGAAGAQSDSNASESCATGA